MTDPSLRFRGLRDGLTVIRIRSHLLHFRYRGGSIAPDLVPLRSADEKGAGAALAGWEDEGGALRQGERRLR